MKMLLDNGNITARKPCYKNPVRETQHVVQQFTLFLVLNRLWRHLASDIFDFCRCNVHFCRELYYYTSIAYLNAANCR